MPTFVGVIRSDRQTAALETRTKRYTLVPYPANAPLSEKAQRAVGRNLFGYLAGEQVQVDGSAKGDVIYNARLAASTDAVADIRISPTGHDPLAQELEQYFKKGSKEVATRLTDAGVRTVSAFYHRVRNNPREEVAAFADYLKVPPAGIREFLKALETDASRQALVRASPRFPVQRGVNLKRLSRLAGAGVRAGAKAPTAPPKLPKSAATPGLPTSVSLVPSVTPVKNQGVRGTCVAHTAVACLEAALIRAGAAADLDLSEQYLYWACKEIDGARQEEGTFIEYAVEVLLNGVPKHGRPAGTCGEAAWPYHKLPVLKNEGQGPPPATVPKADATSEWYRARKVTKIKHSSIKAIKETLAAGSCVGLSVYTYHFWTDDYAFREGVISLPLGIKPDGAHAICLVGYADDEATPHQDGYFIFKNSWDVTWGYGRTDPGYGSLPYRYVLKEAIEAYAVQP